MQFRGIDMFNRNAFYLSIFTKFLPFFSTFLSLQQMFYLELEKTQLPLLRNKLPQMFKTQKMT